MGATNGDATPRPRLKADSVKILSRPGIVLYGMRCGWRYFVTGRELFGMGDNATFLRDATMDHGYPLARPYAKLTRARWRRVARRWAFLGIPSALVSLESAADVTEAFVRTFGMDAPGWTDVPWWDLLYGYGAGGAAAGAVVAVPKIKDAIEQSKPNREFVYPSVQVACKILGVPYRKPEARRMLDLPKGWGTGSDDEPEPGAVMPRLYLPAVPLDANTKKRIVANVGARLGIPDPQGEWQEVGGRAHVTFKAYPMPPKVIDVKMIERAQREADLAHPVIGFAQGGTPVALDYDDESPHVLVSGGSGTGKSTLLRSLLSYRMSKGNGLIVLDYKRVSHLWAADMPRDRALYFYKIADIHDALVQVDAELTHRMHGPIELLGTHRPVDIMVEELNSLTAMLRAYWRERRAEIKREIKMLLAADPYGTPEPEPPLQSPAIQAIANVTNLGRQVKMFCHVAGQRVSANALGANGGDIRENFQSRLIAKWTKKTWAMLTNVPWIACPSGPRGMWALVQGDKVSIVRVPNVSDDDARTLALSGPEPTEPILSSVSGHGHRTIEGEVSEPVQAVRTDRYADKRGKLSSLSDASAELSMTLNALRIASKRDDAFPAPVKPGDRGRPHLYDLAALCEWRDSRRLGPGGGC